MKNKKILADLKFVRNYIPQVINPLTKDALFSMYVTKDRIDADKLQLLKVFVFSHLQNNKNITIFLLTNHTNEIKEHINDKRFRVLDIPFVGIYWMHLKIYAIYHLLQNFNSYQKLYIFDSDVIAVHNYHDLKILKDNFDIGFTFLNNWKKYKKFPFNGGFMIVNFENKKIIEKFKEVFINTYDYICNNYNEMIEAKYVEHHPKGNFMDQYLILLLLKDKIYDKVGSYSNWQIDEFNYKILNEFTFNYSCYDLKKMDANFELDDYFSEKIFGYRVFIHLKGPIKDKFIYKFSKLLKISF